MTRRSFLLTAAAAAAPASRPNIVLFLADDLGYGDITSYGAPDVKTPHIDAIGKRGVRFTQFYASAPECTPTRTALLTGRYPQRVGGLECAIGVGNVGRYDDAVWLEKRGELGLPPSENTLAMRLKAAGYDTAMFGKWHLGYGEKFSPNRHGFDEAIALLGGNADYFTYREDEGPMTLTRNGKPYETTGYLTDVIGRNAIEWLGKRRSSKPFFLYVPFTTPHTPIQDPAEFDPKTGTAPRRQRHRPTFARMVEHMDRVIGDIVSKLRSNTIAIFTSDNGADPNGRNAPFRGNKSSTWEGGIRVPCVIAWPGIIPAGSTTEQPAITMDLTATILAAAGADKTRMDGMDLRPVLDQSKPAVPRTLFWRYRRAENNRKAVRKGDIKLVVDNGVESLHYIAADPGEKNNVIDSQPAVANELRALLGAWEKEVRAPRLAAKP